MSASVFPARAGMSPKLTFTRDGDLSVPRASGDEPNFWMVLQAATACSPRERG